MDDPAERARLTELITACWSTQVIHVAVRLGLPDRLAAGPAQAGALAEQTGSHPGALFRLLRAMEVLGLVRRLDGDRFELTPMGRLLGADAEGSIRGMAMHWGERLWGALSQLDQSVQTGRPWKASGLAGFQQMAHDPAQMVMFHQSMTDQTGPVARAILGAYDFSRFRSVMDVGGSYGALLAAVLKAHPALKGSVYDLADLAAASRAYLEGAGVSDRAAFNGGDFFQSVPAGADAYMLKMIIHDWDDAQAQAILSRCREAADGDGVVLVMERIVPAQVGPSDLTTIRGDMLMLTAAGGMERTEQEYRSLFSASGLSLRTIYPTASGFSVMEGAAA